MAEGASGNDFFLRFGSNADVFSNKIGADLEPGITKVNELRAALIAYEQTAGEIKGGSSPLGITFQGLDEAAQRIEAASVEFSRRIGTAVEELSNRIIGLEGVLKSIKLPRTPPQPPTPGSGGRYPGGELTPEQEAILRAQREGSGKTVVGVGRNATVVAKADIEAAEQTKRTRGKVAEADTELAKTNTAFATQAKKLVETLKTLNGQLSDVTKPGKGDPAIGDARPVTGEITVGNSTSNPIPVIVVGGDPSSKTGGHAAHHGHTPTATTATQDAAARNEVEAAALVATDTPMGTRKSPRPLLPEERPRTPQEWVYPLGRDPKETATRAFGLRENESFGEYSQRVGGVQQRANKLLDHLGGLHPDDAQRLTEYIQSGGEIPKTKLISDPTKRIASHDASVQAEIDAKREQLADIKARIENQREAIGDAKDRKAPRSERDQLYAGLNYLKEEREAHYDALGELTGAHLPKDLRGVRSGTYIATPELARATPPNAPQDILRILAERDQHTQLTADYMNRQMLTELVRDPHMTQDSLPPEGKKALRRIDQHLLDPERGGTATGDFKQDSQTLAGLFKAIGLGTWKMTPDEVENLKQGAVRRNDLFQSGQNASEIGMANSRGRKIERVRKELASDDLTPERREELTRKYSTEFPTLFPHGQEEKSNQQVLDAKAEAESRDVKNKRLQEQRLRARNSLTNAENFTSLIGRVQHGKDPAGVTRLHDPENLDEDVKVSGLARKYQAVVGPTIADLDARIKRAEQARDRARGNGQSEAVKRNERKLQELRNQKEAIAPPSGKVVADPVGAELAERRRDAFTRVHAVEDTLPATASRMGHAGFESAYSDWFNVALDEDAHQKKREAEEKLKPPQNPNGQEKVDEIRRRSEAFTAYRKSEYDRISQETLKAEDNVPEPEAVVAGKRAKPKATEASEATVGIAELEKTLKEKEDYRKKLSEGSKKAKKTDTEIAQLRADIAGSNSEPEATVGKAKKSKATSAVEATTSLGTPAGEEFDQGRANFKYGQKLEAQLKESQQALRSMQAEMGRVKRAQSPGAVRKRDGAGTVLRERSGFAAGDDELGGAIAAIHDEMADLRYQLQELELGNINAPRPAKPARGSSGGGGKPPKTPTTPPATGSPDEPEDSDERPKPKRSSSAKPQRSLDTDKELRDFFAQLKPETQQYLRTAAQTLKAGFSNDDAGRAARQNTINQAAAAFKRDDVNNNFGSALHRAQSLSGFIGIPLTRAQQALKDGGKADDINVLRRGNGVEAAAARMAEMERILVSGTDQEVAARLREFVAQEKLNQVLASGTIDAEARARAEAGLISARATRQRVEQGAAPKNAWEQFTGRPPGSQTFQQGLQRHIGSALENTIGYTLVFSGFEKLREVVHTGLEAQAAFVRLQASLDANGRSADGLRTKMEGISSATATPLEHVIGAASELAVIFKSNEELTFATKISAELANISQGALTATEAAVGLRDVTAAYGLSGTEAIQAVGDQMAHLSQLTGVNVKDIVEGTTQIAQEAHQFGLSQRQAATLTAYSTYATGEPGEASAYQLSRMMTSLNHGVTQSAIVKALGSVGEGAQTQKSFDQGKVGDVLTNLMTKWTTLSDPQRQNLASMMGTGITGRIFSALMNAGPHGVAEMGGNPAQDKGKLDSQNAAYLHTLAGTLRQLSEDFQNLGSVLQRLGAFDLIGIFAKSLDKLLNFLDTYIGKFADLVHKIPGGSAVASVAVPGLEALGLFKLLGGPVSRAASGMFGGTAGARVGGFMRTGFTTPRFLNAPLGGVVSSAVAGTPRLLGAPFRAARRLPGRLTGPTLTNEDLRLTNRDLAMVGTTGSGPASAAERTAQRNQITIENRATRAMADFTIAMENATRAMQGLAPITKEAEAEIRALGSASAAAGEEELAGGAMGGAAGAGRRGGMLRAGGPMLGLGLMVGGQMLGDHLMQGTHEGDGSGKRFAGKALSDAGTGALIGSFLGPEGTFIGAGVGAIVGEFSALNEDKPKVNTDFELHSMRKAFNKNIVPMKNNASEADIEKTIKAYDSDMKGMGDKYYKIVSHIDKKSAKLTRDALNKDKEMIDAALEDRIAAVQGLGTMLNADQFQNLNAAAAALGQFNTRSLRANPAAIKTMLADAGAPNDSTQLKDLQAVTGSRGQNDIVYRNKMLQKYYQDTIKSIQLRIKFVKPGSAEYPKLEQELATAMSGLQQATDQVIDGPIQFATSAAAIASQYGDTHTAIANLQRANQLLAQKASGMTHNDPEYIAVMQQILQNRTEMAHLSIKPEIQRLELAQAGTADPVEQSKIAYEIATKNLVADSKALADKIQADQKAVAEAKAALKEAEAAMIRWIESGDMTGPEFKALNDAQNAAKGKVKDAVGTLGNDKTSKSDIQHQDETSKQAAAMSNAQGNEASRAAQAQAGMAGIRNTVGLAQAQLTEARRQEAVYSSGKLKDMARYYGAVAQEKQAEIQIADAVEGQKQAAFAARSALATLHGNSVGAAATDLAKAQQAYTYAVKEYGKDSEQAQSALAQVYQSQQNLINAELERQNAALDLQIARLNARGHLGDDVTAAKDNVKKAENALHSYLSHGGKKGTAEYDKLQGDLVTAHRTAFETAMQAQLDTLDFQRETYKITSSQEVQALQEILKNKQLTLKDQRDITLKIKNLQQSIREQLTQGGLNIPSDIKLPTAYEVRRSLGAGFAGSGASVNTVNNNQQVQINNNVPTAAIANQIANQVITMINQQTGQQLRANSSTPRLVPTR